MNWFSLAMVVEKPAVLKADALLEIGAYFVRMTPTGMLETEEHFHTHVMPFEGANLDKEALEFNGIDPFNPLRGAVDEKTAISSFFKAVDKKRKKCSTTRLRLNQNSLPCASFYVTDTLTAR